MLPIEGEPHSVIEQSEYTVPTTKSTPVGNCTSLCSFIIRQSFHQNLPFKFCFPKKRWPLSIKTFYPYTYYNAKVTLCLFCFVFIIKPLNQFWWELVQRWTDTVPSREPATLSSESCYQTKPSSSNITSVEIEIHIFLLLCRVDKKMYEATSCFVRLVPLLTNNSKGIDEKNDYSLCPPLSWRI